MASPALSNLAAASTIEEMACSGHPRAAILDLFDGEDKTRASLALRAIYEMDHDSSIYWRYSFKNFHPDTKRYIWREEIL